MDKLIDKLKEIFEVENLDLSLKFEDFDEWDSLSSLSIIAMLDSDYQITFSNKDLLNFIDLADFCKFVMVNGK
jgi:acyl carrier protein